MVGAAIAVLAEGAPEFADDHHHRVLPCWTLLVGEGGEPAPELLEPGGEEAARAALADVRVPAAHVDEADVELLLHQLRNAPGFGLEAARAHRVAAGAFHLSHHVAHDVVAHREALVDLRGEGRTAVHGRDERALAGVHGRLPDEPEAHVRHLRFAAA